MAEDQQPTGRDADHAHEGEAVGAAARAMADQATYRLAWHMRTEGDREQFRRDAEAAITAAEPHLTARLRADLDAANAEVERATTMNANWQAEYRKARGRALQWSGRFFAANRTVVEQAATIEAVRALVDNARAIREKVPRYHPVTRWVVSRDDLRAVLPPVDGEKRNHDQEAT